MRKKSAVSVNEIEHEKYIFCRGEGKSFPSTEFFRDNNNYLIHSTKRPHFANTGNLCKKNDSLKNLPAQKTTNRGYSDEGSVSSIPGPVCEVSGSNTKSFNRRQIKNNKYFGLLRRYKNRVTRIGSDSINQSHSRFIKKLRGR